MLSISNMASWKVLTVVLLAVSSLANLVAAEKGIIKVAGISKDVFEFALMLNDLVKSETSDERTDGKYMEVVEKFQQIIENSDTKIIDKITVISKFETLESAIIAINGAMVTLKRIFNTSEPKNKDIHVKDFEKSLPCLSGKIHFLPELLSYAVPGHNYKFLPQLIKINRCNLSVLKDFAKFYLDLLEDGFVIEVMHYRLIYHIDIPKPVKREWNVWLENVQEIFNDAEADCVSQFKELAYEDFLQATDARTLGRENTERYLYNWSDVTFFASIGTHQFHYHMTNHKDQLFFQKTDSQNKLAYFGSRTDKTTFDKTYVQTLLRTTSFGISSKRDQNAAKHLGEAVKRKLKENGYYVSTMVVYFIGSEFSLKGDFTDPDSSRITYTLPGVVLEYCYESGFVCFGKGVAGKTKETSGSFAVQLYLGEEEIPDHLVIHGGAEKHSASGRLLLLVIFLSAFSYTAGKTPFYLIE